jgi:outer membrane protein OmpA-like peptidoglycan-associated protein
MSQQTAGYADGASASRASDPQILVARVLPLLLALALTACAHPVGKPRGSPPADAAHVGSGETLSSSNQLPPAAADAKHADTKRADTNQADTKQADTNQADTNQADTNQADTKQADTNHAGTNQADANQADANQASMARADANQAGTVTGEASGNVQSGAEGVPAAAADGQKPGTAAIDSSTNVGSEDNALSPPAGSAEGEASATARQLSLPTEATGGPDAGAAAEPSAPPDATVPQGPMDVTENAGVSAQGTDSSQAHAGGVPDSSMAQGGESSGQSASLAAADGPSTTGQKAIGQEGGKLTGIAGAADDQHPADNAGVGAGTSPVAAGGDRIASIDVPTGHVKVDEEYRPQTLGGMLPLVLGVNEDGRFDFDQYALRAEVKRVLDDLVQKLNTAEYDRLDIVGYTDRIGTTDYNQRLSELRAFAVAQYLMAGGIPENKIHYEGDGDRNPLTRPGECNGLARDQLIVCLQKDRRVEIQASIHRKHATVMQ